MCLTVSFQPTVVQGQGKICVPGKKKDPQEMALPSEVESDSVTKTPIAAFIKISNWR